MRFFDAQMILEESLIDPFLESHVIDMRYSIRDRHLEWTLWSAELQQSCFYCHWWEAEAWAVQACVFSCLSTQSSSSNYTNPIWQQGFNKQFHPCDLRGTEWPGLNEWEEERVTLGGEDIWWWRKGEIHAGMRGGGWGLLGERKLREVVWTGNNGMSCLCQSQV